MLAVLSCGLFLGFFVIVCMAIVVVGGGRKGESSHGCWASPCPWRVSIARDKDQERLLLASSFCIAPLLFFLHSLFHVSLFIWFEE